jgi:hypothetical protein
LNWIGFIYIVDISCKRLWAGSNDFGESVGPEGYSDTFPAIDSANFQVEPSVKLEGGNFEFRPYELPDGSKLYALGGMQNGSGVFQVIDLNSNTLKRSITFDEPGLQGISAGTYYPFACDSNSHTLFVGATHVVLAIDAETNVIKMQSI